MGNNMKRGIIIDFFGMPGCGKTTIAHMLAKKLNEKDYMVQDNIYKINNVYSSKRRMLIKIINTITFTIGHYSYMRELFLMLGNGAFEKPLEAMKQWINVCFVLTCVKKSSSEELIIADQGIIQAAISLTMNCEDVDILLVIKKLCKILSLPIKFVYVTSDINIVLERLNYRINGLSRVERESNLELRKKLLQQINTNCELIANSFECIVVDNNKNINDVYDDLKLVDVLENLMGDLKICEAEVLK